MNINKVESVVCDIFGKFLEKFVISRKEDEWDSSKDYKVFFVNFIVIGIEESLIEVIKLVI